MNQQNNFQTIIIGAGPAGLFASAVLKTGNTLLLEKKELPGRKLMISGTGQCNFTHSGKMSDFKHHYGDNYDFIKYALNNFTNQDSVSFFSQWGVRSFTDKNGKVFPVSLKAADILNALLKAAAKNGARLLTGSMVKSVAIENELFTVKTESDIFTGKYLIIATGGKSYPSTGSTGDGYRFAESLSHLIVEPRPALAAIVPENYELAGFSGNTFLNTEMSLWRNEKKIRSFSGDLLLTHHGLSGPGILNFSRYFKEGDTLRVNFSDTNAADIEKQFISLATHDGRLSVASALKSLNISRNIAGSILSKADLSPLKPVAEISKHTRRLLVNLCCAYPFVIKQIGGFKNAMATTGGVELKEINPVNMESRIVSNLYFCGEVIDIDGDTGGYNIQAALSTAWLAAIDINKKAGAETPAL